MEVIFIGRPEFEASAVHLPVMNDRHGGMIMVTLSTTADSLPKLGKLLSSHRKTSN